MTKKLFAVANNKCAVEGADSVMMQECLLGGHLYLQVLKEKLYGWLTGLRILIMKRARNADAKYALTLRKYVNTDLLFISNTSNIFIIVLIIIYILT